MNLIYLIRKKWFILVSSLFLCGIILVTFQYVYKKEIYLTSMFNKKIPDTLMIANLYDKWIKSIPKRDEIGQYHRLSKILIKIGRKQEAIKILNKLLSTFPKDRDIRLLLAVELHNQKRYIDAEEHFAILLKEETKK